jgi:hypothetical protein
MGQSAKGKHNASLDEKKARAAGRRRDRDPESEAIMDAQQAVPGRGTGGAFGREEAVPAQEATQPK